MCTATRCDIPGVVGSDYRCAEFTTLGQIALYRYNPNPYPNP